VSTGRVIENAFGAHVGIPNRTIANVVRYPLGYIRAYADVLIPKDAGSREQIEHELASVVSSAYEQFAAVFVGPPLIQGRQRTEAGREYFRIEFHIWPGRAEPIEKAFRSEVVSALKAFDPTYEDWMVTVNYEVVPKAFRPA
jgi:hypothetical protein